jgi:anti-sigma-K factor RskA
MNIANRPQLDALCGEYVLGTLRGAARRRFARSLMEEPQVAQRLKYWQGVVAPRYTKMIEAQPPSARVWTALERELGLARYRTPWHRRAGFWRAWAVAATAALVLAIGVQLFRPEPQVAQIAQLSGQDAASAVTAHLSKDGRTLVLHSARPVLAGPAQSYELWLLPPDGSAISLAVLGSLDARFEVPEGHRRRLREGGKLAVSVEPAGGSPTGNPTGPVILAGPIKI